MTAVQLRDEMLARPASLFDLPILQAVKSGRAWRCLFCGEERPDENEGRRHVLSHFLPYEIAESYPVEEIRRRL